MVKSTKNIKISLKARASLHMLYQGAVILCMISQLRKIYGRYKATLCVKNAAEKVSGLNDLVAPAVTFN